MHYIHLNSVTSTNDWVKQHADTLPSLTCVTADEQTAGRGSFKKKWISPRGKNLYVTIFFSSPSYLPNLGQIMAFSAAVMLREKGFPAEIKWPNDILIQRKKIAGILAETTPLKGQIGMIVGVGININMEKDDLEKIGQPATSLLQLSGKVWDIEVVLEGLVEQFLQDLTLLQQQGFAPFQSRFEELLAFKGEKICCREGEGICRGVSSDGRLELVLPSGEIKLLTAGASD